MNEKVVKLLEQVIKNKYNSVALDSCFSNDEEFYYEFKIDEKISENDFEEFEKEIKKLDNSLYFKL